MILLNDGKFNILSIKLFRFKIEVDYYITEDCSTRMREYGLVKIKIWKSTKIKQKHNKYLEVKLYKLKTFNFVKLKSKS